MEIVPKHRHHCNKMFTATELSKNAKCLSAVRAIGKFPKVSTPAYSHPHDIESLMLYHKFSLLEI